MAAGQPWRKRWTPFEKAAAPNSRLTELGEAMLTALERHPKYQPDVDKAIVVFRHGRRGGLAMSGYDDDTAIEDLLAVVEGLAATAKRIRVIVVPNQGPN